MSNATSPRQGGVQQNGAAVAKEVGSVRGAAQSPDTARDRYVGNARSRRGVSSQEATGLTPASPPWRHPIGRGSSPACAPNASTFGSLVMALCKAGRREEAEAVVTAMPRYRCRPSAHIFNSLLAAAHGDADLTVRVLGAMGGAGVGATGATVTAVMGTLLWGAGREGSVLRLWRAVREGRLRGDPCDLMAFLPSQSVALSDGCCLASSLDSRAEQRRSSGLLQEEDDARRSSPSLLGEQRLPRGSVQAVTLGPTGRPQRAAWIAVDVKMVTSVLAAMARLRLLAAAEALWAEAEARRDCAWCQVAPALPGTLQGSSRNDGTGDAATAVWNGCNKARVNGWVAGHNGRSSSCRKQAPAPVAVATAGAAASVVEAPQRLGAMAFSVSSPEVRSPPSTLLDCQGSWGPIDGPAVGAMLAVYVACGRLEEARRFLECTREREGAAAVSDSVVCVLLREYACRGMVREMERLFDWHAGIGDRGGRSGGGGELSGSQGCGRKGDDDAWEGDPGGSRSLETNGEKDEKGSGTNGQGISTSGAPYGGIGALRAARRRGNQQNRSCITSSDSRRSNISNRSSNKSSTQRKRVSKPVYEAMIDGCRASGELERAEYWRREMQQCGFAAPNQRRFHG